MRLFYLILEALLIITGGTLMMVYANYHDPFQVGLVIFANIIYLRSWKARNDILLLVKFLAQEKKEEQQ